MIFSQISIILSKFRILIFSVLSVVASLFAVSCDEMQVETGITISNRQAVYKAGQETVSISASGEWALSLFYYGSQQGWATLSQTSGRGSKDVILEYDENGTSENRSLLVILTSHGTDYAVTFVQLNEEASGWVGAFPGWLELPSVAETDDCRFYTHDMTLGTGKVTRNYSFLWDRDNLVSHWVAYPLNKGLIGNGTRTVAWSYDPKVPREDQPRLDWAYDGGYDRGHQLPSADRYGVGINEKTFYFTNMTPQRGELNQKAWAKLENMVRDWSYSFDTLYVVTGADIRGATEVAYDNQNKAVTVPVGYYKALLGYKKGSSIGGLNGGYIGIGFYFEHRSYSNDANTIMNQSMSIDELESRLGYDFFVNLPDKVGADVAARIESEADSWWY